MNHHRYRRRVVVTGMGAISCLGLSVDQLWDGLIHGRSGIGTATFLGQTDAPCRVAGEIKGFDPAQCLGSKEARRMARFSQIAVAAAGMAIEHAGLQLSREDSDRVGVVIGNGGGGLPNVEEAARVAGANGVMQISPFFVPMNSPNMAAANVSRIFGLKGWTLTITTACATGTQAIGEASEVIRRGAADVVLAGGSEAALCKLGVGSFSVMGALSRHYDPPEKASRPFDAARDGFVPAEGGAMLVMESMEHALERGAEILAEVAGYGVNSDAYHLVQPCKDGDGAARAMQLAIQDAEVRPSDIDYVNAHGTSTPLNDAVETVAIKRVFGDAAYGIPVSSTKSMIGHALGAAGTLEAVACVKTIMHGVIHPTINYEHSDAECDLDYVPNVARTQKVNTVLSNSFAFGGYNACLIFSRFDENRR